MIYDQFPLRKTIIITPIIVTLSQIFTSLVFYFNFTNNYYIVLFLRIIMGIFGDSLFILQVLIINKFFRLESKKYIGFGNALAMIGSPINSIIIPIIYTLSKTIYIPLLVGVILNIITIIIGVFLNRKI